uniref:Thymidine kinase n=1 Tax=Mimivirus LCMiAC02 TaxID=2506609 RepID=A0A481Z177_9VIRU|nr:MAG: thymidine kinase [Mimivirus LCMiAC02]
MVYCDIVIIINKIYIMDRVGNKYGKLILIIGSMWSSKTTQLLATYTRYKIGSKKCLAIRFKHDNRYDQTHVVTHDKRYKLKAILCTKLYELGDVVDNYDVICIDEVQFFNDGHIMCQKWANSGKIVVACGLNGKFDLTPWDVISKLIPLVDEIKYNKAVCIETGNDAIYTSAKSKKEVLKNTDGDGRSIGGEDMYSAVDRETYCKNNDYEYQCRVFFEFMDIFDEFTKETKSKILEYFKSIYIKTKKDNGNIYNLKYNKIILDYFKK